MSRLSNSFALHILKLKKLMKIASNFFFRFFHFRSAYCQSVRSVQFYMYSYIVQVHIFIINILCIIFNVEIKFASTKRVNSSVHIAFPFHRIHFETFLKEQQFCCLLSLRCPLQFRIHNIRKGWKQNKSF